MLIISKFIYDELAKERKINYLIKLVVLYAAIITFFYIADLLISRFSMIRQRKINHRIEMDNKKKWLYMPDNRNGQIIYSYKPQPYVYDFSSSQGGEAAVNSHIKN